MNRGSVIARLFVAFVVVHAAEGSHGAGICFAEERAHEDPAATFLSVIRSAAQSGQWSGTSIAALVSSQGALLSDVNRRKDRPWTVARDKLAPAIDCLTHRTGAGCGWDAELFWGLGQTYLKPYPQDSAVRVRSATSTRAVVTMGDRMYRMVFVKEGTWKLRELHYEWLEEGD
jgi:hypothetical protein